MFTRINLFAKRISLVGRKVSTQNLTKNISPGSIFLLSIPVGTFCLGTWQVKRRTWKLNLIQEVQEQNKAPPVPFPYDLEELSKMEYRRVYVRGTFDHSKEMYIGPRQLVTNSNAKGGNVMSTRPLSGVFVITPFHIRDRNMTILVNRGWVPKGKMDPNSRVKGQINDEIELVGTVRLPEKRPQFSPKTKPGSNYFYFRDVPKMAEMANTELVFLDADASSSVPEGPIGGQTRLHFRNEHLSYIITWYSLSAATFYIWYKKFIKQPKIFL